MRLIWLPLFGGKLQVDLLSVHYHVAHQMQKVSQGQGEQTHINSFLQALLCEHRHVDDVGRPTNQKQDWKDHRLFYHTHQILGLCADHALRVVPSNDVSELQHQTFWRVLGRSVVKYTGDSWIVHILRINCNMYLVDGWRHDLQLLWCSLVEAVSCCRCYVSRQYSAGNQAFLSAAKKSDLLVASIVVAESRNRSWRQRTVEAIDQSAEAENKEG